MVFSYSFSEVQKSKQTVLSRFPKAKVNIKPSKYGFMYFNLDLGNGVVKNGYVSEPFAWVDVARWVSSIG